MPNKIQCKNSIKKSLVNRWERLCDFREIQTLPKIINDDEYIVQAVNGYFSRNHNNQYNPWHPFGTNGTGLIILTNKEIILFNHALLFDKISPTIPLQQLHSITPSSGLLYGYIDFDDGSAHPFRASHILAWKCDKFKKAVDSQRNKFIDHLNSIHDSSTNSHNSNNPSSTNSTTIKQQDPIKELQELNQMYESHKISTDDYRKMKHKIIG